MLFGARVRVVQGLLEVFGGQLTVVVARCGFVAVSLGHVIIGVSSEVLHALRLHEQVHVRQAERWGVFFVPVYLSAGLWQWLRGRHAYDDHPFEQEAFAAEGRFLHKKASGKEAPEVKWSDRLLQGRDFVI